MKASASIQFINSGGDRVNADRINEGLIYWVPAKNVSDFIKENGTMNGYRNDGRVGNNPLYNAYSNKFTDNVKFYVKKGKKE